MDNLFAQFINAYGVPILYALLTALAGALANAIKALYAKYINDKTKKAVAQTVVMAVQQLYEDLDGPAKFEIALDNMLQMLGEKGITITKLEAQMLIESAVGEFKNVFMRGYFELPEAEGEKPAPEPEKPE